MLFFIKNYANVSVCPIILWEQSLFFNVSSEKIFWNEENEEEKKKKIVRFSTLTDRAPFQTRLTCLKN